MASPTTVRFVYCISYLRQIILSQLYFCANMRSDGSMIPPRRRSTRCRVDSDNDKTHKQSSAK